MIIEEYLGQSQKDAIFFLLFLSLGGELFFHHTILAENVVETVPTVGGITVIDIVHGTAIHIGTNGLGEFAKIVVPGVHSPIGIEGVPIAGHKGTGHQLVASDHGSLGGIVIFAVKIVNLAGGKASQNNYAKNQ